MKKMIRMCGWGPLTTLGIALLTAGCAVAQATGKAQSEAALGAAYAKYKGLKEGNNADYIPALAMVDWDEARVSLVVAAPLRNLTSA